MQKSESTFPPWRQPGVADGHVPELLQTTLIELEHAVTIDAIWAILVQLGSKVRLPHVDLVYVDKQTDQKIPFLKKNYNTDWLDKIYADTELSPWADIRLAKSNRLTPTLSGVQFPENTSDLTPLQDQAMEEAAKNGLGASFSIPVSVHSPPYHGIITFSGEASRRETLAILRAHGWALQTCSLLGFGKMMVACQEEFRERANVTDKQADILRHIGLGYKDRDIAERLGVTVSAVRQRMTAMTKNTGLQSRAELAALAMSLGLLPDPTTTERRRAAEESLRTPPTFWGMRR